MSLSHRDIRFFHIFVKILFCYQIPAMWHWTRVLQLKELHMFLVEALKVAVPWCRKTMCGSASSAALGASLFWGTDLKCCCKKLKVPKIKYCQPSTCPVSVFDVLHCTCDLVDEALRSEQNTTASPFAVLCCSLFSELDPPSIICLSPPIFPPFFPPSLTLTQEVIVPVRWTC